MAKQYWTSNTAMPTTAAPVPVTTGTAIKTLLQIATPATEDMVVVAWGITFDGTAAAAPIKCELVQTDVAATVTAHVAAGIINWSNPNDPASLVTLGTAATGFTASAEGTTTATGCSTSSRSHRTAATPTSGRWTPAHGCRSRSSSASA
jgi:hypothetical protein